MHASFRPLLPLRAAALLGCLLTAAACDARERTSSYRAALESISAEQLQQHVDYLADDKLRGREAGRQGGRAAGDYLAERLAEFHLRGGAEDGTFFQPFSHNFRNVLALLPGSDPNLAGQVVVVSAHYDHLGFGHTGGSRGPIGRVHNGADDNASGTAGLLELAEALTTLPQPPARSVLFAFFDAEEKGLLGAKHWVAHPTLPLEQVVAIVNVDMIGRLRDDRLTVVGSRSAYGWRRLVCRQNEEIGLRVDFPWTIHPAADHYPFFARGVPFLMLHTGQHADYHTPRDDAELVDPQGMRRVTWLLLGIVVELADAGPKLPFRPAARRESDNTRRLADARRQKAYVRLGVSWSEQQPAADGLWLTRVNANSAAARAGIRAGDRVLSFAGHDIHSGTELTAAVMSAVKPAAVVVQRRNRREPLELTVNLDGDPLPLGFAWRADDAEPGTVVVDHVVPDTPAARAGLQVGDRVYRVDGRDFADRREFAQLAGKSRELLIERQGLLHTVVVRFDSGPLSHTAASESAD